MKIYYSNNQFKVWETLFSKWEKCDVHLCCVFLFVALLSIFFSSQCLSIAYSISKFPTIVHPFLRINSFLPQRVNSQIQNAPWEWWRRRSSCALPSASCSIRGARGGQDERDAWMMEKRKCKKGGKEGGGGGSVPMGAAAAAAARVLNPALNQGISGYNTLESRQALFIMGWTRVLEASGGLRPP